MVWGKYFLFALFFLYRLLTVLVYSLYTFGVVPFDSF